MQKKNGFKDILKTDEYFPFMMDLLSKGFITGYYDGNFKPQNPITRTELLKLLFLVKKIQISNDESNYFLDVSDESWQKKYINTAVGLKLVSTANKKFFPNGNITRVEALKIAIILFVGDISLNYTSELVDVGGSEWFAKYVQYAVNHELLSVDNNYFYPNRNITRYEVIELLYKLSSK